MEVIVVALLLMPAVTRPVEAGTCTGHYWSAANDDTANTYYGAYGSNTTQDASVTGSSNNFFVNSTWIRYDAENYAEVGWIWRGGWTSPKAFAAWNDQGNEGNQSFNTLTVDTDHYFETRRQSSSSTTWYWYADGSLKRSGILSQGHGTVGAQQERNNACDNPDESHWWLLQRMATFSTYTDWGDLDLWTEDDPDYCLNEISDTEFKVEKGSGSSC